MKLNTDWKIKTFAFFLYRNKDKITKFVKDDAPRIISWVKTFIINRKK